MFENKKILVLAPHTDDGELGCGGTIAKYCEAGNDVYYVAFSTADESVPKEFPSNQLAIEVKNATFCLGIPKENLFIFNYTVRKLNYVRQEILEHLIELRHKIQPDIVFLPSSKDIHQDHVTINQEGIRAFKHSTILGYELIWNNLSFDTDCFIELTEKQIDTKISALSHYVTQKGKHYMESDFIRSLARIRGTQINVKYAETFEVIRWIIKSEK
ncbi:MAG: PIG-L family deacetylase [Saprospiraceae bacterium]|nr:PIG-L family deacetylase [Saprospiraceae bacterium]